MFVAGSVANPQDAADTYEFYLEGLGLTYGGEDRIPASVRKAMILGDRESARHIRYPQEEIVIG